ncbi:MAG: PIN domain-containing protein [Dehalococcoidia bacterium]
MKSRTAHFAKPRAPLISLTTLNGTHRFLQTTPEAAELAGDWRYRHRQQGIQISTTDALIAATAFVHRAHVVTANPRDYPMPEITVVPVPRPGKP